MRAFTNMIFPSARLTRYFCLVLMIVLYALASWANQWQAPEEQLSRKIAAVTGPGAVALTFSNRSSLDNANADEIHRGLLAELALVGIHVAAADQAVATVQVSLSENLQSYVWVAEIQQGNNPTAVVMVEAQRTNAGASEHQPGGMTIHKTLLWSDEHRILDVAELNTSPQHLIILEPESIELYRLQENRWQPEQSLPLVHLRPWPRDLRGRLILRKDHLFDAYLPGVVCRSTAKPPLAVNCVASDDPWPLGEESPSVSAFFSPSRNFFTGALSPGIEAQKTVPAFYSAAPLPRDKYTLWVLSGVDGHVHFLDGITDHSAAKLNWGSDIASVRSGCGLGWQVLVTGNGASETIQAFEIPDREPVTVSQALEFSGSISAFWTEAGGGSVIAVSKDSGTARYEAYRLSLTCGQ